MTFMQEVRKPYNLFTTCLAVLGIVIGVALYYMGQEKREPFYLVSDPVQIFDNKSSLPSIRVNDKLGNPVSDSIFVTEISLWNAGNRPIEPADVRIPISIELSKAERIIDFVLVKQTQPEVLGFSVAQDKGNPRALNVAFKHLDPNLGAKIKVVYTGSEDPGVVFHGSILGAHFSDGTSWARRFVSNTTATFLSALMGAVVAQLLQSLEKRLVAGISPRRRGITRVLMFLVMALVLGLLLQLFFAYKVAPV